MHFLAPLYAMGGLLAIAPILLHLFGRERAQRRRFPAARLLAAALHKRAPHARLEAWLLVALRTLAVLAVAAVLARPIWQRSTLLPSMVGLRQSAVIVLDDSLSMARHDHGRAMFDRARSEARDLVQAFAEGSEVAIVSTSDASRDPMPHLERERDHVLAALSHTKGALQVGDTTATLARAAALLSTATAPYRRIYLVSDLAAAGFDAAQPRPFPDSDGADGIGLSTIRIGTDAPANDAVTSVVVGATGDSPTRRIRATAELRSVGRPAHTRTLALVVDGVPVARGIVPLPSDGVAEKRFEYAIPAGADPRWVEVALDADPADALREDDARAAPIHGGGGRVILVDGAPGSSRREDETFYLETALRAARGAAAALDVIHEEALAQTSLDDVAAVFLCNPRPSPVLNTLVPFVTRGGGLFVSLGDNVEAIALSTQLASLLPSPIEGVRDLSGPGGVAGGTLHLAAPSPALLRRLPSLADERGREGWRAARAFRIALFRPVVVGEAADRELLASFDDGTPALLERRVGLGRVVALATTVDRAWSDLAIQPIFPALAVELAEYLGASRSGSAEGELVKIGHAPQAAWAQLVSEASGHDVSVEITRPDGARTRLTIDGKHPERTSYIVELPGRHLLRVLDGDSPGPRPLLGFVGETDPRESDPKILPHATQLDTRAPTNAPSRAPAIELWHAIAALLLLLLLGESLIGLRG